MLIIPIIDSQPSRRQVLMAAVVTAAGLLLPPITVSAELYPWVEKDLQRRRSRQQPRFIYVHYCPEHKANYLCPDRWEYDECGPTKECKRMGWIVSKEHTCSSCLAQYDDANRAAWLEANRV